MFGKESPKKGKTFEEICGYEEAKKTKRKMRNSAINRIEKAKFNGEQMTPGFNRTGCMIIEEYGKTNDFNFKHALNGKEYKIDYLGYWLDGYDKEKNVVIEIDEPYHFSEEQQIKDKQRQKEIEEFLHCKFIRINYKKYLEAKENPETFSWELCTTIY